MHTLNRRQMLISTGAALAAATLNAPRRAMAAEAEIIEKKVISHRPELYHGWSTVARRKNGQLLVVGSGGREEHVCPFGWVEMMRSDDNGKTWSSVQLNFDRILMDIWGTSSSDVFAVGSGNAIFHYNGQDWTLMNEMTNEIAILNSVWGSSSTNVIAGGYNGKMMQYDGKVWS